MPSIVIGKVKGDQGEKGFSPTVTLTKEENTLTISVTDAEGTKTESIQTGESVQSDWNTTDTALPSYIKNKPEIPNKVSQLQNDSGFKTTDNNTTYSLTKSGSTITLTGSDGSTTSVTDSSGSSGGGQVVSSSEPSGQTIGDHWLLEY